MYTEIEFSAALKTIVTNSDALADDIHQAGLFAISQANEHGNINFARGLVDALGKKHDKRRVVKWLVTFAKLANDKEKGIVFLKRKDIKPENLDSWLEKATALPYWDLTAQPVAEYTVDYLSILKSAVDKHKTATDNKALGKTVTENNIGVYEKLAKLYAELTAVPVTVPVQKDTITA